MIKELAASIGAAIATETLVDADLAEWLADSLEGLANYMDRLSELLEVYASNKEESNET